MNFAETKRKSAQLIEEYHSYIGSMTEEDDISFLYSEERYYPVQTAMINHFAPIQEHCEKEFPYDKGMALAFYEKCGMTQEFRDLMLGTKIINGQIERS